jgi:uncharacterized membrane protein
VSPERRRAAVVALTVVLSVACALGAHYAIVSAHSPIPGALLSLIPVAILGVAFARRTRRLAVVLPALLLAALVLWLGWGLLERNFTNLFFIEHAGANLLLGLTFGRTLLGGREPLCTRFARMLHDPLEPGVARYTRQVTIAWTVFFFTLFILSCALYGGQLLSAWSFLANIASPVLIVAMFAAEYAIRVRVLPDHERVGILGGIRAFSRHMGTARFEAPR